MLKRFDHDVDLLRVGAGGDSISSTLEARSEGGWEIVDVVPLPAAEDEKTFEGGEARILFRLALFWKKSLLLEPALKVLKPELNELSPSGDRDEEDGWSRRFPRPFWVPVEKLPVSVSEVFLSAVLVHSEDDLEQLGILEHYRQKMVLQTEPR